MIDFNEYNDFAKYLYNWQELFLEDLEFNNKDLKTSQSYERIINFFIEYIEEKKVVTMPSEMNHRVIQSFIAHKEQGALRKKDGKHFTFWTKSTYKKGLKLFFDYIEDESDKQVLFKIDWRKITFKKSIKERAHIHNNDLEKMMKYLETLLKKSEQLKTSENLSKKLKNEIKSEEYVYTLNLAFKLGVYAGMRASEICNIELKDFGKAYTNGSNKQIIQVHIKGKGGTEFSIPIIYGNIKRELTFFTKIRKPNEPIMRTITGLQINRINLYRYFENLAVKSKVGQRGCHILRHTFGNRMADNKVDLADAQDMLRHADPSITRIYFKRNQARMESVASKIA
jgi:integrase/recombinase XerD